VRVEKVRVPVRECEKGSEKEGEEENAPLTERPFKSGDVNVGRIT
jgi:hypothetical protein